MTRRLWIVLATATGGLACLLVPGLFDDILLSPYLRAGLVGIALFAVPARLLAIPTGIGRGRPLAERVSIDFVCSSALLLPALALPVFLGTGLGLFVPAYAFTVAALATAAVVLPRRSNERSRPAEDRPETLVIVLTVCLMLLLAVGAWELTRTGSIDRWWYLAYVRAFVEADHLNLAEPFLASSYSPPRFAFNGWLLLMAAWARLAAVDPVWLYERACAPGLVPVAFSALLLMARSVFGPGRLAWLSVLAGGLLWAGGSLFPVVTRLPEDKLVAMMIIVPVAVSAFVSRLSGGWRRWLAVLALAAALLATVHALVYAILLLLLVPFGSLMAGSGRAPARVLAPLFLILVLGGAWPAMTGLGAHRSLGGDGAQLDNRDHPVVRVHSARSRLLRFDDGSYMVKPRLLAHPITLLAIASVTLLRRRRRTEQLFLLPATVLPLSLAFVPPLAVLAGSLLFPWMVYRLLWALPVPLLVGLAMERFGNLAGGNRWLPVLLVVSLAMPWTVKAVGGRFATERSDLSVPGPGAFRATMKRVAKLEPDALIAASPEISERIPALTGRRVLAVSDRGTVVFSPSREQAERRLRSRAAVMSGSWRPSDYVPEPTHVLFEPGTAAAIYCAEEIFSIAGFQLCSFAARSLPPGQPLTDQTSAGPVNISLENMLFDKHSPLRAECTPALDEDAPFLHWPRPGPWSARFADSLCTVRTRRGGRFSPNTLAIEPFLGHAVEELTVTVVGDADGRQAWRRTMSRRLREGQRLELELPAGEIEVLRINVVPNFLPFLKLKEMSLGFDAQP